MNKRNRSRAYVRAAAQRQRARRFARLQQEWGWRYNATIDLDELRRDLAGDTWRPWRISKYDSAQTQRLREALALPELSWSCVILDRHLVDRLGGALVRELAPWSFTQLVGLDQRMSYHRMEVEPEWTLPDIVREGRPVRKRVWRRDEIDDFSDEDFLPARRLQGRRQLYERWAGGELRT